MCVFLERGKMWWISHIEYQRIAFCLVLLILFCFMFFFASNDDPKWNNVAEICLKSASSSNEISSNKSEKNLDEFHWKCFFLLFFCASSSLPFDLFDMWTYVFLFHIEKYTMVTIFLSSAHLHGKITVNLLSSFRIMRFDETFTNA